MTLEDVKQAYDLEDGETENARHLLIKSQQQGLCALEINPSYGAEGKVLCGNIETLPEHVLA